MSEDLKMKQLFAAFEQTAQTFQQAEEKAKSEKGFEKIDRFRTPDEGEYLVRVLPLAPIVDANGEPQEMNRKGFEYQLFTMFLDIDQPADKKGKVKQIHVPVIDTTQPGVGMSVDLLKEYLRIAKEMYADDQEVIDLISGSESRHRIRFSNQRVMYVMDMTDGKPKGPMLWQVSNNNYKDIDAERLSVWTKEIDKASKKGINEVQCPLCGLTNAWPLTVTRTGTKFNDTKYAFKIDRGEDQVPVEYEWLAKLMELPRIPDEIYHYTRYQFEATLEFLRQYDEKHDLAVCNDEEFLEAVEKVKGELSPDDNSHFTVGGKTDGKSNSAPSAITLESLNEQYDYILDNNLGKDSSEYEELQGDIQQFIEDNNLDVIVKRSKKISDILDEIEEALDSVSKAPVSSASVKSVETEEEENDKEETEDAEKTEEEADDEEKQDEVVETARPKRRRPARIQEEEEEKPSSDDTQDETLAEETEVSKRRRPRSTFINVHL